MNPRSNLARRVAYLVLLFATFALIAAEPKPPEAVPATQTSPYNLEIKEGMLQRAGGNLKATLPIVIDALRDQFPEANIVLSPGLASVMVSDLKLRAASLGEELEGLRVACGEKFTVLSPAQNPMVDPSTGLPVLPPDKGLFSLVPTPKPERERVVEAFNISPYLQTDPLSRTPAPGVREKMTTEGLDRLYMMVNETVRELKRDQVTPEDNLSFRFHAGANLLVVVGPREDVEVARKVVNALPGMPNKIDVPPVGDERERLMMRYGGRPPAVGPQSSEDAFRRRYGLGPAPAPGQPSPGAPPQGTPAKP